MTVRGAIFLGVGAMVGAGIFALLGETGAVAGSAVWVSFLIAGLIAEAVRQWRGARDGRPQHCRRTRGR
jgi:L-asparagine transporter-like permease